MSGASGAKDGKAQMAKYDAVNQDEHAALIYFRDDLTEEECQQVLRQIGRYLKPSYNYGVPTDDAGNYVQSYDPNYGSPVWYIP